MTQATTHALSLTFQESKLIPEYSPPSRPVEYAEETLVRGILDGQFPPGSLLPGERELATQLGITRPTLREVLRRLERDGWLGIRQGKSTYVKDYWREGGLNVLSTLVRYGRQLPPNFILNLLQVRLALAPTYTRAAVEREAATILALLEDSLQLADAAEALASFDWTLHHCLTVASGNPIYTLILNGFVGFYEDMARRYFARPEARARSRAFYAALAQAVRRNDPAAAEEITRAVMVESIELWQAQRDTDG
ncbi:MAG: fatty acid metabolism transcriptional regulator FadR [Chloroflexota bacterium]